MSDLIYLDVETTGLEPEKHEVWELAYAINDGGIHSYQLPHSLATADLKALELNHYWGRVKSINATDAYDLEIRQLLEGNTIVCANPTFDRMFMRKRWGMEPYHYRSIDIEVFAMPIFGWIRPRGLKDIYQELVKLSFDIPEPNHSARGDVETLRECYRALWRLRNEWRG